MAEYVSEFLSSLTVYQYAPETAERYRPALRDLAEYLERAGKAPPDVDYVTAEGWLLSLERRKYKGSTLRCNVSAARSLWKELQRRKIVQYNPFRDLRAIRYKAPKPEPLSEVQVRQLIDSEPFPLRKAMWEVFYGTGYRISSVRFMLREHVDFDAKVVRAPRKGGEYQVQNMTDAMEIALREHMKYSEPSQYLFACQLNGRAGRPLATETIRGYLREAAKRVGIERKVWPHLLRHTIATHLLDRGADLRHVQEFLDHETIQSTEIYTHVSKAKLRRVVKECHPRP